MRTGISLPPESDARDMARCISRMGDIERARAGLQWDRETDRRRSQGDVPRMSWRVKKMCENCPFRPDAAAISLAPGRLDAIKDAAVLSQPFHCHKTVYGARIAKRPRRLWKECAGAIAYRNGVW